VTALAKRFGVARTTIQRRLRKGWRPPVASFIQDNLEGHGGHVTDADLMAAIENVRTILAYAYNDYDDCC
jgi:hypothetical protein